MMNLDGKVALVTGASGAIGSETARKLHSLGATLVISGTRKEKLEALASELGSRVTIRTCDLHDEADCQKMVEEMEKIDILVCNAGITRDMLSIKMSNESFAEVLDINLKASFILNRSAIQKMIRAKAGRIINISSIVAVSGNIDNTQAKIDEVITKFDGYERFLYFESSSASGSNSDPWPKQHSNEPYTLYSVTSSQALAYLGSDTMNCDLIYRVLLSKEWKPKLWYVPYNPIIPPPLE